MTPNSETPTLSRRAIASRNNGAKSRGPKTAEGKARSSRNALKHGLRSNERLSVPPHQQEEFDAYWERCVECLKPANSREKVLVDILATRAWQLRQLASLEADLLSRRVQSGMSMADAFFCENDGPQIVTLARYTAYAMNSMHRALIAFATEQRRRELHDQTQDFPKPSLPTPRVSAENLRRGPQMVSGSDETPEKYTIEPTVAPNRRITIKPKRLADAPYSKPSRRTRLPQRNHHRQLIPIRHFRTVSDSQIRTNEPKCQNLPGPDPP